MNSSAQNPQKKIEVDAWSWIKWAGLFAVAVSVLLLVSDFQLSRSNYEQARYESLVELRGAQFGLASGVIDTRENRR